MKTVAAIADSIENSAFDPSRCVATIQDLGLDPLVMVSTVYDADGHAEKLDVTEVIDSVFAECDPSVLSIGYLTDDSVISYLADKLGSLGKKLPVMARPCLISDEGDILVEEGVYHAFEDQLLQHVKILMINNFEAELLSGIECQMESDYMRAAKKIHNLHGCHVVINSDIFDKKCIICVGARNVWEDLPDTPDGFDTGKYELSSAISSALCYGISSLESIEFGLGFCLGARKAGELTGEEEETGDAEPEPEPEQEVMHEKPAENISFVSPGKALRDIARNLDSDLVPQDNRQSAPVAVTSVIDEHLGKPKGEVSDINSKKVSSESVTEFQSLRDRLEKLKEASSNLSS